MAISGKRFRSLLKDHLSPHLRSAGFHGSSGKYSRRLHPPYVHLIQLFVDKYGDTAWMELGVHLDFLPGADQTTSAEQVDVPNCVIRRDLETRRFLKRGRVTVPLGDDDAHAKQSIGELVRALDRDGLPMFEQFLEFPGVLGKIEVRDVMQGSGGQRWLEVTSQLAAPFLLMLARIHLHLGDRERSQAFVDAGLSIPGPGGRHLDRLFVRVRDGSHDFCFSDADLREFKQEQESFFDDLDS